MPAIIVPNGAPSIGPGYLFQQPGLGGILPTNTAANGVFTDAWPAAFVPVGMTAEGTTVTYEVTTEGIQVAEYFDPILTVPTGRSIAVAFAMMNITDMAYDMAMNGSDVTTTGTGGATVTQIDPPDVGDEQYRMFGWESQDGTQRMVWRQTIQSGSVSFAFQKAPNAQQLALSFQADQPPGATKPMSIWLAGERRLAAAA